MFFAGNFFGRRGHLFAQAGIAAIAPKVKYGDFFVNFERRHLDLQAFVRPVRYLILIAREMPCTTLK